MTIKELFKKYIYPTSVFAGGMIGVGFLSLPYVAMKSGIIVTSIYFVLITALIIVINLMFSEVSLATPDYKRFPGFVGYHLGKFAQTFSVLSALFAGVTVLSIYLLVGSNFLATALFPFFDGNILTYAIIYFVVASAIIYFDIKVILKVEFWIIASLFVSLILIFLQGFSEIKISHIFFTEPGSVLNNLFLPYGALLFSLWGIGLIPETEELLGSDKNNFKKVITIATIAVSIFYFLFTILILSISGTNTAEMALSNLPIFLRGWVVTLSLLVGVAATFTAFISQGIILKKVLMYDLNIKKSHAFIITCFVPMIIFLSGFSSFIPLVSFVGGILLGIDGILILLMYKKVKGKSQLIYWLSLIFIIGIIYEIIYFIK